MSKRNYRITTYEKLKGTAFSFAHLNLVQKVPGVLCTAYVVIFYIDSPFLPVGLIKGYYLCFYSSSERS